MGAELILSATGDQTVDNTTTETSVFAGSVPAGTPGTDELLIARHIGDVRNDSGAAATVRHRWKYGGVTLHDVTTISLADAGATNRYADIGTMFLGGQNATNAQRSMYEHRQSGAVASGQYSGGNDHNVTVNTSAVDSTSSQTFEWTAELSAANTELEFRRRGVWVERWTTDAPGSGTAGTRIINLDATETTVVNTTTETTVYSCTIPGGTLGTGNLLIARLCMDALNNSGASAQWWTDVYYGSAHVFEGISGVANTTATTRRAFPIEVWLGAGGSTGSQVAAMLGQAVLGTAQSGEGLGGPSGSQANNSYGSCSVDSTANQTFSIAVTMSVANTNIAVRRMVGMATVVKA